MEVYLHIIYRVVVTSIYFIYLLLVVNEKISPFLNELQPLILRRKLLLVFYLKYWNYNFEYKINGSKNRIIIKKENKFDN
jgi:hypothetical protein